MGSGASARYASSGDESEDSEACALPLLSTFASIDLLPYGLGLSHFRLSGLIPEVPPKVDKVGPLSCISL